MFSNKAELGWDTEIEDSYGGKKRVYTFNISGKRYSSSTKDILVDVKAAGLYTTGTRIFKAVEESDKEGKVRIVKDYWPAVVYDAEHVIRSKILADIKNLKERNLVKMALLTPIDSEYVKVDGRGDHTEEIILRRKSPSGKYKFEVPDDEFGRKEDAKDSLPTGPPLMTSDHPQNTLKGSAVNRCSSILHRRHCRIVFREAATPYYKIDNMKDMLLVLEHSIDGMSSSKIKLCVD